MKDTDRLHSMSRKLRSSVSTLDELMGSLKKSISRRLVDKYASRMPVALLRRAVDDAEELARSTDFPHLFFPALAEEKVRLDFSFISAEATPREPQGLLFAS